MKQFDNQMAVDIVEDALASMNTPHARGIALGLCGAFYMCGLLSAAEWRDFQKRIPSESWPPGTGVLNGTPASRGRSRGSRPSSGAGQTLAAVNARKPEAATG